MIGVRAASPRLGFPLLRWISVFLLLAGLVLTVVALIQYSRTQNLLPPDTVVAGIPVGGLSRDEAARRILEAYSAPVELIYGDATIWLDPAAVGFEVDVDAMLAAVEAQRQQRSFWSGFWDYLWGRHSPGADIPLVARYSEARLREYLEKEIAPRYDHPPVPPQPVVGTTQFSPGRWGTVLNVEQAIPLIERALFSRTARRVTLPVRRVPPTRPSLHNLQILLEQTIDLAEFDGIVGLYLYHLDSGDEIHFLYRQGQEYPIPPDLAFTAASTIKIPIMVSAFRRVDAAQEPPDSEVIRWIREMITLSGNDPADWLMENLLDPNLGPLIVTQDMRELGLENTFLAGYFYPGAPLLARFETPANQRPDLNTEPDPYNQTTPSEMGMLLVDIYQCAYRGGGTLLVAWPQEITRDECRLMLDFLSQNRIGVLLEASVPESVRVDHKHGWISSPAGGIQTLGDAGIIYTPNGDYVLSIYIYRPQGLVWDEHSKLIQRLGQAVYSYYNPPTP